MIVDYSTFRPSMQQLHSIGVTSAGRYLGWDSCPGYQSIGKNLTAAEAAELRAAGISVFLAFEYAAEAALNGSGQGRADGELATAQLAALGAPADMTVYFAVDFDIADYAPASSDPKAKLGPAAGYFEAIRALRPAYKIGVYGGYYAVSRVLSAGLAQAGWQTIAWSGGQWDSRAVLRQLATTVMGYADMDLHIATAADFGQWPHPGTKPVVIGGPHATSDIHELAQQYKITEDQLVAWNPQLRPYVGSNKPIPVKMTIYVPG